MPSSFLLTHACVHLHIHTQAQHGLWTHYPFSTSPSPFSDNFIFKHQVVYFNLMVWDATKFLMVSDTDGRSKLTCLVLSIEELLENELFPPGSGNHGVPSALYTLEFRNSNHLFSHGRRRRMSFVGAATESPSFAYL